MKYFLYLITIVGLSLANISLSKDSSNLPISEIKQFVDVYNAIKNEYIEPKSGKSLIHSAIKGMLEDLDPHSDFYTVKELKKQKENISGSYQGFGFELESQEGQIVIVTPFADSAADKAKLKPGDIIEKIDNTSVFGITLREASDLLMPLKEVTLTISRQYEKPFTVTLKKSTVKLSSVKDYPIDDDISVIKITQFQNDTADSFAKALRKLKTQNTKGMILDLRNNPGGLLDTTVDVADLLLTGGLVVSTKNINTNFEEKLHAKPETLAPDLPIVVLINEGSASAAELLAGALQDHKRAIVVGQNSFGKGSVQTLINLDSGDAVKLTTSRYYTPNGKSIQNNGIAPDIYLNQLEVKTTKKELLNYREKDIYGHLKNNQAKNTKEKNQTSAINLAKKDLMLFEAANILRTLILTKQNAL